MSSAAKCDIEQINLRVPSGMRNRLKEIASANRRSVNSEIITILEREIFDPLTTEKADATAS